LEEEILELLSKRKEATTTTIAKELNVSRTTIIRYLKKLLLQNRINYREVGPSRLWYIPSPEIRGENVPKAIEFMRNILSLTEMTFSKATMQKFKETLASMENEIKLQAIKSQVKQNLTKAKIYRKMLEVLEIDMLHQSSGYSIVFAIDYHDLCRYLHPSLDRSQLNWEEFSLEQTALHYIFSKKQPQLILLPPYVVEFILHMQRIREDYMLLSKVQRPNELLHVFTETTAPTETTISDLVKSEIISSSDVHAVRRSHDSLREVSHLMRPHELKEHLVKAVNLFKQLSDDKKVISLNDLRDVDSAPIIIQTIDKGYLELMVELGKARPDTAHARRYFNNHIDSIAALTTKKFSERNLKGQKYMVLLSSTKRIQDALLNVTFDSQLQNKQYAVPILRDLNYILLAFYFHQMELDSALQEINKFKRRLDTYISLLQGIESIEKTSTDTIRLVDWIYDLHDDLKKSLWDLSPIVEEVYKKGLTLDRVQTTADWRRELQRISAYINKLSTDPELLRSRIEQVLRTLDNAVSSLDSIFSKYATKKEYEELTEPLKDLSRT